MTRLLISVRSADEARLALTGGADLIDVKEPRRGALGAADAQTWQAVADAVDGRAPLSAALGELAEWVPGAALPPAGFAFAKLGLSGAARLGDWQLLARQAARSLPGSTELVAVVYADWREADAPPPEKALQIAIELGCPAVLADTFDKRAGSLVDHWTADEIARFVADVQALGKQVVLAGSLSMEAIPRLAAFRPDYIGVRGAACDAGRDGPLSLERVRRLRMLVGKRVQGAGTSCTRSTIA